MKDTATVTGVCPLIDCMEVETHEHPICPRCGALGATNMRCAWCIENIRDNYPPFSMLFLDFRGTLEAMIQKAIEHER